MFRMTPYKNTNFTDAEVKVTLGMIVEEDGKMVNRFYILDLEMAKINSLTLSWTLVHAITGNSPLYQMKEQDYQSIDGEIIVFVKTFDEMFSTTVAVSTSYTFDEFVYGAKFEMMYSDSEDNSRTVLHLDKLDSFYKVDLQ